MDNIKLADMLFPDVKPITYWENRYPKRNLPEHAEVTRYAPSPTGFMHIGNFLQMFLSYSIAKNSGGIFIKRLEDTDLKREKDEAFEVIKLVMDKFGIFPDEYQERGHEAVGEYGPYVQTLRKDIYLSYIKQLVAEGKAFPCFCKAGAGKEDILKERELRFAENSVTEYDICRDLSEKEIKANLDNNMQFAIRLKTLGTGNERVVFTDLIKGEINALANAKDVVLLKQDGIPPYTFAHIIDDHLMGVTIIVRGEEYISSTPVHIEIVKALGFAPFKYCHNPLICKIPENGNKRKISKRYDPEADMRYYFQKGYPIESVLEYLLNLISSSFQAWQEENPSCSWKDFSFGVKDITAVSPLLDLVKLNDMSKNVIAKMSAQEVFHRLSAWAKEYEEGFNQYLNQNKNYCIGVLNIDRETAKPRKDIAYFSQIKEYYNYMFTDNFDKDLEGIDLLKLYNVASSYRSKYKQQEDKQQWFNDAKEIAKSLGYATDNKEYKNNPNIYCGNMADFCLYLRLAITGRKNSPDLFEILTLLGESKVKDRLDKII